MRQRIRTEQASAEQQEFVALTAHLMQEEGLTMEQAAEKAQREWPSLRKLVAWWNTGAAQSKSTKVN